MNQNRYNQTPDNHGHEPSASNPVGEYRIHAAIPIIRNKMRALRSGGSRIGLFHQRFFAPILNLM
jgi:hypothetical protein